MRRMGIRGFLRGLCGFLSAVGIGLFAAGLCETGEVHLSVDPIGRREGYSAVLYDNTSGLPTSEANAIAETEEGFIWIGGYAGLIRYDGNTFERIDPNQGVPNVVSLFVDSRDRLWIGTNDSGLAMLERGEFTRWEGSDALQADSVRAIAEDGEGTIYVATTAGVGLIGTDLVLRRPEDERLQTVSMKDIRLGPDGLIYGLTQEGGIFTLRNGTVETFLRGGEMAVPGVISFLPDPEAPGYLYLGTNESSVYYGSLAAGFSDAVTRSIAPLAYAEHFESIDGRLWICSDGIGVLDPDGFHLVENVPMNNSISRMMMDYEGNLWFTSMRQGVMKIVSNQFTDIFERYQLSQAVVNSTCLSPEGLFIGTDSGLIVLRESDEIKTLPVREAVTASGDRLEVTDLIDHLRGCRIRSVIRDSRDRIWISTWRDNGLICYDQGRAVFYRATDGLFSERVRTISEAANGDILVACSGGVNVIRDGVVTGGYSVGEGITNTEILTVLAAANGDILAGSDGGGLYVIRGDEVRCIDKTAGLKSNVIMRIKRDEERDIYWIVTSNSIAFMSADYQVTTLEHFPYSNNFDLFEDRDGNAWILSSNGIYVIPIAQLLENGTATPVYYGRDNGLQTITTANSYSDISEDGDLYIAGSTGVVKVNIHRPFESVNNLKAAVAYVDADGKRIYPDQDGSFEIDSGVQKLTIYSYVYNYSLLNPSVTYDLGGFEKDSMTIPRNELVPVNYTNLKGGIYQFVLQIRDSLGRGNKEVRVSITKKKAFYEETAFLIAAGILSLLAVAGVVIGVSNWRMRKMRIKEEKDRQLIREITEAFAKVIDMKDNYTRGHSSRVAKYTAMLARELGYDRDQVEQFYRIALLHDIGKVGVPQEVLNKPGKLTDEEFMTIKSHTTKGYETLKEITIMPELAIGAQSHHERPDGRGYPNGLKGEEIPRVAQIIAVADCFDAMYSDRPYRNRMNFDKAVSIIRENAGTQLTRDVVEAFLRLVDRGEFREPDDDGGGTMENIDNIHKRFEEEKPNPASGPA
ncbi:MAG: HD domain-containing protein [Clostridia bacterium]|nr:HD domain-containing protein [Clostridia bacterium]